MTSVVLKTLVFCSAAIFALPIEAAQTPHPAVVRVIAMDRDGISLGTGCLVAIDANHGMVVTNWHVVRDAVGTISVVFPDGFASQATILRTDKDWDLAALGIEHPRVAPMVVSTTAPQPGDILTIAGYGSSSYRAISGKCTEYLSPGNGFPAEIVELDVSARHGDSGGPIWNSRGEMAGVLFGAAGSEMFGGYTMGSYCGRVRRFLAVAYLDFRRLPVNPAMLTQSPPPFSAQQAVGASQNLASRNPSDTRVLQTSPVAALTLPPPPSDASNITAINNTSFNPPNISNNGVVTGCHERRGKEIAVTGYYRRRSSSASARRFSKSATQRHRAAVRPNQNGVLAGIGVIAVLISWHSIDRRCGGIEVTCI